MQLSFGERLKNIAVSAWKRLLIQQLWSSTIKTATKNTFHLPPGHQTGVKFCVCYISLQQSIRHIQYPGGGGGGGNSVISALDSIFFLVSLCERCLTLHLLAVKWFKCWVRVSKYLLAVKLTYSLSVCLSECFILHYPIWHTQRVMESGFFILQRFFLRVDGVLVRLNETRFYHSVRYLGNFILLKYLVF